MADDFEKAILFTFDQSGAVDSALKEKAVSYCAEAKRRQDIWLTCIEHFRNTQYAEVKFWCLQTLLEAVRFSYASMAVSSRSQIKQSLLGFMGEDAELVPFLKNKLAQILVYIVQVEYPEQWPSFFQDLLALLPRGAHAVDMFCRILLAIDDDVISLDIPRSQEESRRSMHLKDSMRERCIHELAEAWYQLVAMYKDQRPGLAAMVLEAVKRYICWIDIGLVANSRFMSLLFSLSGAPSSELQGAACGCIAEVLSKRMDAFHKLRLIQQLGTVEVCKSWARGVPPGTSVEDMEEELAEKYAALLATLANELLDCWKRAENGVTSIAAVGLAVDPEALQEARETTEAALGLLSELFPAIISALYNPTDSVSMAVVPFLLAYMQRVRRMQDVPERHMQHARMALDGLHACAMYPSDMPLDTADGPEGAAVVDEMEEAVTEKRREVFTLFKNVAKLSLAETASFVGARLERAIANSQASFQEVEVAVTLLYQLGEGAQEEHAKPGCGVLGQMAAGIMQAGPSLPHARNRLVAVAVLEVFVRYCRVLQTQPSLAPSVLAAVLDDRGMGHRTRAVSTRACYLFQRLVRQLRSSLAPAAEQILAGLEPHLARIAATPVAQGGPGAPAQAGAKGTQGKGPTGVASYLDDRMYAFEAAGLLLNGDDLPEDRQRAFVQGILAPLVQQVEANTERAAQGGLAEAQMVQHALAAISHLAKGFTHHVATAARPGIGELLLQVLSVVLRVPPAAPRNKGLRARVMGLLHRDVEVLGAKLLPYAPSAIAALLYDGMDAQDAGDVLGLLVQIVCRFKNNSLGVCEASLAPVVDVVHRLLPQSWDWSGRTGASSAQQGTTAMGSAEELREKADLQRSYYSLLHALCHNGLAAALSRLPVETLQLSMQGLVLGASSHVDPSVRKTCVQALRALVGQWLSAAGSDSGSWEAFPGFRQWVVERVAVEACLIGIVQGGLNTQDAAVASLLGEVAALLSAVHQQCGDGFLSAISRTGWPQHITDRLAHGLRETQDQKELKNFLRSIIHELQQGTHQ